MQYKSTRFPFFKDVWMIVHALIGIICLSAFTVGITQWNPAEATLNAKIILTAIALVFMYAISQIMRRYSKLVDTGRDNASANLEAKYGIQVYKVSSPFKTSGQSITFLKDKGIYQGMLIQDPKTSEPVLSTVTEHETRNKANPQEWIVEDARMPALSEDEETIARTPSGEFSNTDVKEKTV